jgi:hypothetical protein
MLTFSDAQDASRRLTQLLYTGMSSVLCASLTSSNAVQGIRVRRITT